VIINSEDVTKVTYFQDRVMVASSLFDNSKNLSREATPSAGQSNRSTQRGSADHETLVLVMVGVSVLTVGMLVLNWIKSVKDERVERYQVESYEKNKRKPSFVDERGPSGEQLVY
jgi:hypothetical protein